MAMYQSSIITPAVSAARNYSSLSSTPSTATSSPISVTAFPIIRRRIADQRSFSRSRGCVAMVHQVVPGAPAAYAKDMERLSAKESLLLALKDSGGFEALVTGKMTDMQRIDVNEMIIGLERLNPTPRPTTSPFLEGRWNFEWFGSGSPASFTAKLLFERSPITLANLTKLDVVIKDVYANITANFKLLNSIESRFMLSAVLTVEGSLRMKEEYIEGVLESPQFNQDAIPEQLRGLFGQAATMVQQLPVPVKDVMASGLKIPLTGTFQRLFLISYLDDEILIIRDTAGAPEVLTRVDLPPQPL